MAKRICWSRRAPACVSRRTAASKSSCSKLDLLTKNPGRKLPGFFITQAFMARQHVECSKLAPYQGGFG
jgi:hypothetical protein